jgi:Winged helix DNA-binding domain
MAGSIRSVRPAERRARLAARHHLAPGERAGTAAAAVNGIVALHGTDPASVYLSAWARTCEVDKAAIEYALYEERSLVRMLGMRRTVFVVPAALMPVVQSACADQIAERLRRQLTQVVTAAGITPDATTWLEDVGEGTVRALGTRGSATGAELARDEPRLRTQIIAAADNPYGGAVNLTTRLLTLLSAEGLIVRGRPRGGWTSAQFTWSAAPGRTDLPAAAARAELARAELARRWLAAFGPAPLSDLQWWAGWTAGQVRQAVSSLDLTEVDLGGITGVVLAGDEDTGAPAEPWAVLLPALDPTPMGWRERSWYVGEHAAALFDRSGNIGPTVWWDGRIVGGWAQREDGEIAVRLLEDVGAEAAAAIAAEAQRLREWIGPGVRVTPRFRTPLERELAGPVASGPPVRGIRRAAGESLPHRGRRRY